jgi:hypothetical protein
MKKIPTDIEILDAIYERYYTEFTKYSKEERMRQTKIYVPIDCAEIANGLRVDGDIVFGRLYYHLEKKYGYTQDDGLKVHFFALAAGKDRHCINFPYLASVLATLRQEKQKFIIATWISVGALIISFISLFVSFCK